MIKRYGISLDDRQFHQSLLHYLITLSQNHKTGQQKNILFYGKVSKVHFNLVPIPIAASLENIRQKGKYSKWIINLLYALCGGHHHNDPTRPLMGFLLYFSLSETYQETLQEAVALNR